MYGNRGWSPGLVHAGSQISIQKTARPTALSRRIPADLTRFAHQDDRVSRGGGESREAVSSFCRQPMSRFLFAWPVRQIDARVGHPRIPVRESESLRSGQR